MINGKLLFGRKGKWFYYGGIERGNCVAVGRFTIVVNTYPGALLRRD